MQDLATYFAQGNILVADGATGTMMQSMGLPAGTPPELWNVEKPDSVRSLYRAYLDVGSRVILTNSFGGSRIKLQRSGGLGARAYELNHAAAILAKKEAGDKAYVAGDLGPTGELMEPYGTLAYEDAVDAYAQQAEALVEGGVDLLWAETMSDLSEARAAVEGAKRVTDLPIFCSFSFTKSGRTMMGVTPTQVADTLGPMGLLAMGTNCGEGLDIMAPILAEFKRALPDALLIAKPNAGLPRLENGKTVFDLGADEFAAHMPHLIELGARVIGGCCGSSPQHIAAIVTALSS
ncbi:MAG: homocysteine S-methyltransferase family protein [Anaerolineae bacterium]|nr:homocysteine S-methyltransferase family protein [Anaerolineae bacterium]